MSKEDVTFIIAVIGCILGVLNFFILFLKYRFERPKLDILFAEMRYSVSNFDYIKERCFLRGTFCVKLYNSSSVCPLRIKEVILVLKVWDETDGAKRILIPDETISILPGESKWVELFFRNEYVHMDVSYRKGEESISFQIPIEYLADTCSIRHNHGHTRQIGLEDQYVMESYAYVDKEKIVDDSIDFKNIIFTNSLDLNFRQLLLKRLKLNIKDFAYHITWRVKYYLRYLLKHT